MVDQTEKSVTKMNETKVKTCAKCGQVKPSKDFQRRITIAQARAYLKRQNITRPQTITSSQCKTCRPKPKPPSKLSLKELHNKKQTGDMNSVLADILIRQKKETIKQRRSANMRQRWEDRRNKPIQAFAQHLQNQVDKYMARYHAYKSLLNKTPSPTPQQHALLLQHKTNYTQAKQIKEREVVRARDTGEFDFGLRIMELLRVTKGESDV